MKINHNNPDFHDFKLIELLGDKLLSLFVTEDVIERMSKDGSYTRQQMSIDISVICSNQFLAKIARQLGLKAHILDQFDDTTKRRADRIEYELGLAYLNKDINSARYRFNQFKLIDSYFNSKQ